jgi:HSP20 family protein
MANVTVQKVDTEKSALAPASKELTDMFGAIRAKAFELFERRGRVLGDELADWVQAEKDLFWIPQAELAETDREFKIQVAVPGFDAKNLQVTAQPDAVLVRGNVEKRTENQDKNVHYSEFGEKSLYRRFQLSVPIDIERTTANVENGMLTVTVPKKAADKAAQNIKVAAA